MSDVIEIGVSEYERKRLANIKANNQMLLALGLDTSSLTTIALGPKAPLRQRSRPLYVGERRQSARLAGQEAVDYKEDGLLSARNAVVDDDDDKPQGNRKRRRQAPPSSTTASNPRSCKNLEADLEGLDGTTLGRIIPPCGGQVKRAAMDTISAEGPPTFSRMSGIQEWKNAVALFVNIYGDGYKNVFLDGGKQITWFAQSQQWEGTPVIQRLIHSAGAIVENDDGTTREIEPTPVILFCRLEGQGYAYCGALKYEAHDPERLPIRFVWGLAQYDKLIKTEAFQDLVRVCEELRPTKK